jgi:hypothetical protein
VAVTLDTQRVNRLNERIVVGAPNPRVAVIRRKNGGSRSLSGAALAAMLARVQQQLPTKSGSRPIGVE